MSLDSKFQAASEAAEGWLNTVAMVFHLGRNGNVDMAMRLLMPVNDKQRYNLLESYSEYAERSTADPTGSPSVS